MKYFYSIAKSLTFIIAVSVLLTGCSMQHKFASSFGKRRYTKGFYVDMPAKAEVKHKKKSILYPIAQIPALFTRQITNPALFQNQEIKLVQIAGPANFHPYKKPVAANQLTTLTKTSATTALTNPAPDNTINGSPYNKASLIFFLLAVLASVITAAVAIAIPPAALTLALYIGYIVTGLLDLAAVLAGLLSLTHHEDDTEAAKIVLILNGIIVLGWLITLVRRNTP